jgi:hypothetical protein
MAPHAAGGSRLLLALRGVVWLVWPSLQRVRAVKPNFRGLDSLLQQREGNDQPGVFDYDNAWVFIYYMMQSRKPSLLNLYNSFRNDGYADASFAAIAGRSLGRLAGNGLAQGDLRVLPGERVRRPGLRS